MRYLWLNLDRRIDRAAYTRKMLGSRTNERISAKIYPFPCGFANRMFYGNYLSHIDMIERARTEPTILMEDDLIANWAELDQAYQDFMHSDCDIANFVPWLSMACYAVKPASTDKVLNWLRHNQKNNLESNRHAVKYSSIDTVLFETFGQPFKTQWSPVCTTQPREVFGSASYCMSQFRFCGSPWLDLTNGLALIFTESRVAWSQGGIGGYGTWFPHGFTAAGGCAEDSEGLIKLSGVPKCPELKFTVPAKLSGYPFELVFAEQDDYDEYVKKHGPLIFTQPYHLNHGSFNFFFGGQPDHACGLEKSAGLTRALPEPPKPVAEPAYISW